MDYLIGNLYIYYVYKFPVLSLNILRSEQNGKHFAYILDLIDDNLTSVQLTDWGRDKMSAIFSQPQCADIMSIHTEHLSSVSYWQQVNIGSGNGLVAWGNKPLSETVFTKTCDTVCELTPKNLETSSAQHCGYWYLGAKATSLQYPQCW